MNRIYVAIITVLLLGAAIYSPASDYLHARHARNLIEALRQPYADIPTLLKAVDELDPPTQAWVLDQSRYPVQRYFESRAEAAVDETKGRHDFDVALALLKEATPYYPDSGELQTERLSLLERKIAFEAQTVSGKPGCLPSHGHPAPAVTSPLHR